MRTELQRLHKELDTTILYVTHDQAEAMTMSDRIAVIDSGQLQQIDPPLVCYNQPANLFVAGFIGSPSMNFVEGEVTEDGFSSKNFEVAFDPGQIGVSPGDEVTLGVRPEDVYPVENAGSVSERSSEIDAVSDVLEPMGDEIFVYLMLSEDAETDMSGITQDQLLMSVDPDSEIEEDQEMDVILDRRRVHLFDSESGEAIVHGLESPAQAGFGSGAEAESDD
jgi:multiple sugar transport system ATP-binding protein